MSDLATVHRRTIVHDRALRAVFRSCDCGDAEVRTYAASTPGWAAVELARRLAVRHEVGEVGFS